MILLFKPERDFLRWGKVENGTLSESKCRFRPSWYNEIIKNIDDIKKIKTIGYFLYHGGEIIKKPVSRLTPKSLTRAEKCISFLPEYNDLTFKVARYWLKNFPNINHLLFCDTAFFTNLPEQTSMYGVPYELRKKGVRKYGGYGLCHQWVWEQAQLFSSVTTQKVLSVYLGNHTNIAAIKNGEPLETTIGFTPAEGILSSSSCGDIDPNIIFELHSKGMSFDEINQLLSEKSGFSGLLGKKCSFLDIVQSKDELKKIPIREIFRYNIIKYIGAFASTLGGVDAIVFVSEYLEESMDFILKICHKLEFLGLKCKIASDENGEFQNLKQNESRVKVFCLKYNSWEVMTEKAENLLTRR